MQLYRKLVDDEDLECDWQDQGLLTVYKSHRDFDTFATTAALLEREFGIASTALPGDEVSQFEPTLRSGLAGGWLFPHDAHVRPDRLLASLRESVERHGVSVEEGTDVRRLVVERKRLVSLETNRGRVVSDITVLATGAEAPMFARSLGCQIPIQPGKGYSITIPNAPRLPSVPMILEEHHVAITPFENALRVGSTMEFAGYDRSINSKRLALLMKSAREHMADPPSDASAQPWAGWRPIVYDGLPCIDRAPGAENVVVAAGNGMIGLATAPATGKLAAEIASGNTPHIDPIRYALSRFC